MDNGLFWHDALLTRPKLKETCCVYQESPMRKGAHGCFTNRIYVGDPIGSTDMY